MTPEEAKRIMGEGVLGAEDYATVFGHSPTPPTVPFSEERLRDAAAAGCLLVLRAASDASGEPLTMARMEALASRAFSAKSAGPLLQQARWYADEAFYTAAAPRPGWALVTKAIVPETGGADYAGQTRAMRAYATKRRWITEGQCADSSDERIAEAEMLLKQDWKAGATALAKMSINAAFRRRPVEVLHDFLLAFLARGIMHVVDDFDWTGELLAGGEFVAMGLFGQKGGKYGIAVRKYTPDCAHGPLGAYPTCYA